MPDPLLVDHRDAVVTVTFNRPERRNALDLDTWRLLRDTARDLSEDRGLRCVVLRGAGEGAFSAGADIRDFERHRFDAKSAAAYAQAFEGALDAVEHIPVPTISMIQGFCVGGGLELATATDLRFARQGAKFGVPVARLGIVSGFQEMKRIVRLVGPGHASYIVFSGDLIDAQAAERIGLVNRVVTGDARELESTVYGLADRIAATAPYSHRDHKTIIRRVVEEPSLATLSERERALQFRVFDTDDFQEGRRAFVEKRAPRFSGR